MQAKVLRMPAIKKGTTQRVKLTQERVSKIPLANHGKAIAYLDEDLKGFMVIASKTAKTYYAQRDIRGKTIKLSIGRTNLIDAKEARSRAMKLLAQMSDGIDPREERAEQEAVRARVQAQGMTLQEAVKLHLYQRKKERSSKTIAGYENIFKVHLATLMDKPIKWLGENQDVIQRLHDHITAHGADSTAKKGEPGYRPSKPSPYAANGMVRALRAVYNYARRREPNLELPEFRIPEFNPEGPKDSGISLEHLPVWHKAVMALPNPIRRDYQLFVLFTGMRREAAGQMQWEHVDLTAKTVFVPTPKGGVKRDSTCRLATTWSIYFGSAETA